MSEFEFKDKDTGFTLTGSKYGDKLCLEIDNAQRVCSKILDLDQVSELINELICFVADEEGV